MHALCAKVRGGHRLSLKQRGLGRCLLTTLALDTRVFARVLARRVAQREHFLLLPVEPNGLLRHDVHVRRTCEKNPVDAIYRIS